MGLGQQVRFLVSPPGLYSGEVTANWQSGVATSGLAGADFLLLGTPSTVYFSMGLFGVPLIFSYIGGLTPGATITYRVYITVFGAIVLADQDDYIVGVDANVMVMYAWVGRGQIRVEIMSDNVGDNGAAIPYEYSLKTY